MMTLYQSFALSLQLTNQRINKSLTFSDERPIETQKIVTRAIGSPKCACTCRSSPIKPNREARPRSPIVAPTTRTLTSASHRLDSQTQSPSAVPLKSSGLTAVPATCVQERTFAANMSDDLRLQKWHSANETAHSSPMKSTTTQNNNLQPPSNFFKNCVDSLSPVKKVPPDTSQPNPLPIAECKPSIFHQSVSIFAQRPNLMGRSSPGLNQFSLRHLDGPTCRSFALDHL